MLSNKALKNQKKLDYLLSEKQKKEPVKILPCDENSQVFNWQRTNKKSMLVPKKPFERELKAFNIKTIRK